MDTTGGAKQHLAKGPLPGLEHGDTTGLQRREKLQLGVTVFLRHHDFAACSHTGQQRQPHVVAGPAHGGGVTRTDPKPRTREQRRLGVCRAADGARTGHGFGHLLGNGLDTLQRHRCAQCHLQHTDATGHQRPCQGHSVLYFLQHDHGNHRGVAHHVAGG